MKFNWVIDPFNINAITNDCTTYCDVKTCEFDADGGICDVATCGVKHCSAENSNACNGTYTCTSNLCDKFCGQCDQTTISLS